jgi:hypothetical protein
MKIIIFRGIIVFMFKNENPPSYSEAVADEIRSQPTLISICGFCERAAIDKCYIGKVNLCFDHQIKCNSGEYHTYSYCKLHSGINEWIRFFSQFANLFLFSGVGCLFFFFFFLGYLLLIGIILLIMFVLICIKRQWLVRDMHQKPCKPTTSIDSTSVALTLIFQKTIVFNFHYNILKL